MARYVLRFTGSGPRPAADLERIRRTDKLTVLDDSTRMLLVEAPAEGVRKLIGSLPGWTSSPERAIPLPDSRPRPRRGPEDPGGRSRRSSS